MDEQIDWANLFDFDDAFFDAPSSLLPASSPDQRPLSTDDIEQILLKDDDGVPSPGVDVFQAAADGFFDDIFVDSTLDGEKSGEVVDSAPAEDHKNEDAVVDKETSDDDPLAKKRKRQQRNKDAALRSRERRKMYVKELEMKSKYYEAECRRLGSVLQFVMSENQALRFSLHTSSKAINASTTKQESAVLLLESLLLGSLLWLTGIVVLPSLLMVLVYHQSQLVEEKFLPSLVGVLSRHTRTLILLVGKRFKASRSRMKLDFGLFSLHGRFFINFSSFLLIYFSSFSPHG